MTKSYDLDFICADNVAEFEHILNVPTNDKEIVQAKDALIDIVKNYPRLKGQLLEELDYQISKAENDYEFDEDVCFTSFALHILAHVKCREAINYVWRILKLTEDQSSELDLEPMDLAQIISSLIIDGDEKKLFDVARDKSVPIVLKASVVQPLDYMIFSYGISKAKVGDRLLPLLHEAVDCEWPIGKFIISLIATTTITHKIESLKNRMLELNKKGKLDFDLYGSADIFIKGYESNGDPFNHKGHIGKYSSFY